MTRKIAIIGAGRVGGAIGRLLAQAGFELAAVVCRTAASAEQARAFIGAGTATADPVQAAAAADIVFITTPDGAIKTVCDRIAAGGGFRRGALIVHTSGAHTLDLLDGARNAGAYRAVLHPLQSLPGMEQGARNLPGSFFRIEADAEALTLARELASALGGVELVMQKWRSDRDSAALYHAGAVAVSNYFVALVDYGLKFYEALGADRREALTAVLPLIKGTLGNIERLGVPGALTGPISRGDIETVRGHLEAMKERAPELLALYRALARQTVGTAREQGLPAEKVREFTQLLKDDD